MGVGVVFVHYLVVCCYMMYVHFVLALCVYITEWRRGMYESVILVFVLSAR